MADQATVSQVHVQVEYDSSPLAKVPQLHVQVEYQNAPLAKIVQAHVQVEYDPRVAKNLDDTGIGLDALSVFTGAEHTTESGTGVDTMTVSELAEKSLVDSGVGRDVTPGPPGA